jgi:hypothetical protein
LKSSRATKLPNRKNDETHAAAFLWGKRRGSSALAPEEKAGQSSGDFVILGDANYLVY